MQEARDMKQLPLNEAARIALRDSREQAALDIENKRRAAKGEELLDSLEDEEAEEEQLAEATVEDGEQATSEGGSEGQDVAAADATDAEEDEEERDVLLSEAGHVLVDSIMLKQHRYAANEAEK